MARLPPLRLAWALGPALLAAAGPAAAVPVASAAAGAPGPGPEAGPPGPEPVLWTTAAYTRAVLADSPDLASARESLRAASARWRADVADAWFPSLSFTATSHPWGQNPLNGSAFNSWRLGRNEFSQSAGVSWNLFNSFGDALRLRSSGLGTEAAREGLESALQAETLKALRAYYSLWLVERLAEVARGDLKTQEEQYRLTEDLYKHGMKSLSDLLKTETDLRSSELSLESAEAERRLALLRFNQLLGRDLEAPARLIGELAPATTGLPRIDEGWRRALTDRPEVRRSRIELARARVSTLQSWRAALPSLRFDYSWSQSDPADFGGAAGAQKPTHFFTLGLALPSGFNLFSQTQGVLAARADERRSAQGHRSLERSVREQVLSAHVGLARSYRQLAVSLRKLEISRHSLELVTQQYKQGSADVLRLSQAQRDYVGAQVERMRAAHDAEINLAEYRLAVGEPLWR